MRVRAGFVSNSSVSSFCIFGTELTDELFQLLKKKAEERAGKEVGDYSVMWTLGLNSHIDEDCNMKCVGIEADGSNIEDFLKMKKTLDELFEEEMDYVIWSGVWGD